MEKSVSIEKQEVLENVQEQVYDLHGYVLSIVSDFSHQLEWITIDVDRLEITFQQFEELNPSAEQLALYVRRLCSIVQGLSDLIEYDYTVQNLYLNVSQCAFYLELVARAIESRDMYSLSDAMERLSSVRT